MTLWSFLLVATIYSVRKYADPKLFHWHTYSTVGIAYFCSFGIILLAPTDVALTVIGRRSDVTGESISDSTYMEFHLKILTMYNVMFWPCIMMGSVVMPFQEIYNMDGHFTVIGRMKGTLMTMVSSCYHTSILIREK